MIVSFTGTFPTGDRDRGTLPPQENWPPGPPGWPWAALTVRVRPVFAEMWKAGARLASSRGPHPAAGPLVSLLRAPPACDPVA